MEIDPMDERDLYNRYSNRSDNLVSTTISTIVVQGGPLQLTIALLRDGNSLHIKVAELVPKFTFLGKSLDEALNLQKQHEDLLLNIQNLPTPLEEFYRKVQEKIAANEQQNPRLIEDMADSLNRVWSDIQKILHDRRLIISLNVAFFERLGECYGKMSALEVACRDTMIPIEVEAVREFLEKFKHLRMEVLSSVMNPMMVGNQLLEKLKEIVNVGSLDSRPDQILEESKRSVTLVEIWLEDLSDKRNNLETAWLNRKVQLEQCLILAQLTKDLFELEKILNKQRDEILGTFTLGDSSKHAASVLQDYGTWRVDATALRDKSLKITKTTEEVVKQGSFTGDEACAKAYSVLAGCTEYLDEIDLRQNLLTQSKDFFLKAESVLRNLDDLERELKRVSQRPGSPNIIPVHLKLMQDISTSINNVLQQGYSLIDEVGRTKPEVSGVKNIVDEIERRKLYLETAFSKTSEKHIKVSEELNIFLQQYNNIFSWIESQKRDRIINGPINFMGNNASQAKDCLSSHQQLLRQLEMKEEEFKSIRQQLTPFLEYLEDSQRDDVNDKLQMLSKNSSDLHSFLSSRIPTIELYLRFHQEAEHLTNLFNNLESTLKTQKRSDDYHYIDTVWSKIQSQFTLLKNVASLFTTEKNKVAEPYLQVDRAANCIEKTLDAFSSRQLEISDVWEHWNLSKEINIVLEKVMAENNETISLAAKIEEELYPILATSEELPSELIRFVDNKLKTVLNEIHQAETELSERIDKIDKLEAKDQVSNEKIVQVKNNLNSIKTKLFTISADYSELVDVILVFLRSYQEVYESVYDYFTSKDQPMAENVKSLINDYETFKSNTMEHFRSLLVQSEKIIDRIKMQEPPGAKEHDVDKVISLLERLRIYFESNAASENSELKRNYFIMEFEKLLTDLNENISDLQLQFNDMNDKFGDSAAASKVASLSYEYFERNVDLLNKRIENFITSYKNSDISYPDTKPYVDEELAKLQKRWDEFKDKSHKLKNSLSLAQQYFSLLETVETRYHKTYTFLVNSVNLRKEELRSSDAAFLLIDEIEKYVVENKQTQIDDLRRLSQLSYEIFGFDKTENLNADSLFIFQSFEKMKTDIVDIVSDLKAKEDPVAMINEIDKNILVIESTEVRKVENVHEIVPVIDSEPPKFLKYLESGDVNEGESFAFECIVRGLPEPSVEWMRYNTPINNNHNFKVSNLAGKCRLEFVNVQKADAAVYSCIATNNSGTSQTTANLIVNELPKEESQLAPPTFVRVLQNAYANERASFEFNCLVAGNPLPTVQWFRNDNCIDNNQNYNITYNNGLASLQIPSVKVEDQGIFTVKASNQVGHNECSSIFSVEAVELHHQQPTIKHPLSNVMTRVGQKIKLESVVSGSPRPEIYWMHNGKQLTDRDVRLQNDDGRITLIIPEASTNQSGVYRLIARNVAGEVSTECFVTVEDIADATKQESNGSIKPSVQLPLKDISVFEGNPVRLDCIIVGHPEPEVIWLQNENPIKESNDIQLYFQGDSCTLFINEAFIEDAGVYKVIAINAAGETSSECRVTVTPLNIAEPLVRPTSDRLLTNEMPPKFEKLLTDNFANEGETVELECCLVSGPLPEIKWYLNNKEITLNDRIQSVAKVDGTIKLIIKNVLPDDKGVYTIKATDPSGVAKCFSHLMVKSTANTGEVKLFQPEPEDKNICPTFKELFADRAVAYEDSTKFECIVHGKPTPKVRWFFNDQPVQGRDFLVSRSGERQVLTIPSVMNQNVGKITCLAENEAGKATCVANLTMKQGGATLMSEDQFTTQEDVSGSSFVTTQKHISTTTTTRQANQSNDGVPHSQFHSTSEQVDSSYKKVGDAPAVSSESRKFEEVRESSNEPPQTFAQKILNFTKNDTTEKHESIIANSGQISTGKPIRRNIAPRFVTPLIGKIVDQGVDVTLEGIVDGYPTPTIDINKNGEKIEHTPGVIEIFYNLNKINIKLYNVMTKDGGRYSAVAKNDAGSATSTADLVVKKSIFPPVFGRRLQAQVVKRGERVIMDVEITGTPEPKITWFKDDRPIEKAMSSEYKLAQLGICYKLIIENVTTQDSGKYMVKAENSGGEAQSIADFLVLESQPDRMVEITKTVVFSDLPVDPLKENKTTQMMKNISMTTKQIKINEEPIVQYSRVAPSPSKFVKSESEYESDYDARVHATWRPGSAQSDKVYKPVTPNLPQTPQNFSSKFRTPPPPSSFETPLQYANSPSRPKFEPIEKVQIHQTKKVEQKQKVVKPTPVTPARNAFNNFTENSSQQSNQTKSYYYSTGPQATTYYTAVAGQPQHNAVAHETSNTVHMKESTEKSHRVVNITQTRRIISLDGSKKEEERLEPFPYSPEPQYYQQKPRVPPPPTPTKFTRGEFRESDYDSELENAKIRPVWTPNPSDNEDLHYRRVRPPSSRSSSVPRSYERVMTPMEFDTGPVIMPTKIKVDSPSLKSPQQYFTSSLYRDQTNSSSKNYQSHNVTRDDINVQTHYAPTIVDHASNQINNMNTAFKSKAHQFMKDVITDVNQKQQKPILKRPNSVNESGSGAQAYREESRVSQYGTKHVDPDTGIIYFKYDFGYEFGIIFPGEGKKIVGGIRNGSQQSEKQRSIPPRSSDIEMPIIHEKSNGRASVVSFGTTTPIEFEKQDKNKKRYSLPTANFYERVMPKSGAFQISDYSSNNCDRSGANTPSIVNPQKQSPPKHPPMFITPLKDIAVVSGQTARFECIVQCDPYTQVFWMRNGQVIESNYKYQIEFRNGVCRMTIPQSYQDDAATYECVAQNPLGADSTRAVLMVPGDKRGYRAY